MSLTQLIDTIYTFAIHAVDWIVNIQSGLSTIIAGSFAIIAAFIAWRGVQRQIAAQLEIEKIRERHERRIVETGLTAELVCYSRSLIEATSSWNSRSRQNPAAPIDKWPVFMRPQVYAAVLGRIGILEEGWPASAVISFYGNILEINEMAAENISGPHTTGENAEKVARRMRKMSANLAQALDGLNSQKQFVLTEEVILDKLEAPDGTIIGNMANKPKSIQSLLLALGGTTNCAS